MREDLGDFSGVSRTESFGCGGRLSLRRCRYDPRLGLPSRETGLPRVGVVSTEVTAGAAGTIANNLAALGAGRVAVLGLVGEDGFGWELDRVLRSRGIDAALLIRSAEVPTFTYTKPINDASDEEDLPRIDFILYPGNFARVGIAGCGIVAFARRPGI